MGRKNRPLLCRIGKPQGNLRIVRGMERAHGKTINRGDAFARQNIRRSAGSHDPPILHEENRIGIAGGKIDVVHGKDDALALLRGNTASRCQYFHLMTEIQAAGGLIKKQQIRLELMLLA